MFRRALSSLVNPHFCLVPSSMHPIQHANMPTSRGHLSRCQLDRLFESQRVRHANRNATLSHRRNTRSRCRHTAFVELPPLRQGYDDTQRACQLVYRMTSLHRSSDPLTSRLTTLRLASTVARTCSKVSDDKQLLVPEFVSLNYSIINSAIPLNSSHLHHVV